MTMTDYHYLYHVAFAIIILIAILVTYQKHGPTTANYD